MLDDTSELVADFVTESREGLTGIEPDLLALESSGSSVDVDLINRVFRAIHSMKGAAGCLGLTRISELAHSAENVLSMIRSHELVVTAEIVEALLGAVDRLNQLIDHVEQSNEADVSAEVQRLRKAASDKPSATSPAAAPPEKPAGQSLEWDPHRAAAEKAAGRNVYRITFDFARPEMAHQNLREIGDQLCDMGTVLASSLELESLPGAGEPQPNQAPFEVVLATILDSDKLTMFFDLPASAITGVADVEKPAAETITLPTDPAVVPTEASIGSSPAPPAPPAPPASAPTGSSAPATRSAPAAEQSIRVSVTVLDRLMNLAGELVLGRNQLMQTVAQKDVASIDSVASRINQVTTDLQETIMQTRMQPIGSVFQKFTRVVRDLSRQLEKQCSIQVEGSEVELDKTIIESIGDPLTHLIRNAVDHGIERPEIRKKAGKLPEGQVLLRAFHDEGKVAIVIKDDGAGIDAERIKRKAVERGVITAQQAATMPQRDAIRLIFHAGLSTAEKVTDVSGRGVGMDVVRNNLEKLGGTIEIDTTIGQGSTFYIRLPLTLAIIPSLIVRSGGQPYAIPQVNIEELVRIRANEVNKRIRRVKTAEVLQLRDMLLPLVRLSDILGVTSEFTDAVTQQTHVNERRTIADRRQRKSETAFDERQASDRRDATVAGALNIIVLTSGKLRYGLIVDGLHDSEEIVVKPLGRHLTERCLAGATVLGDGCVAMILDVVGIANRSGMNVVEEEVAGGASSASSGGQEMMDVLLFRNDPEEQFGVPMSAVARIERIAADQIDTVAGREVLQYRGVTLELVSVENVINAKPRRLGKWAYVIVIRAFGQEMGLVAPRIMDIRSITAELDTHTFACKGVLGSLTVDDKVTRILEVFRMVEAIHPEWICDSSMPTKKVEEAGPWRILVAEDSSFFRKKLVKMLHEEGYEVTEFADGRLAWEELQINSQAYDIVVTDIEMPNMNGFELCERIRANDATRDLPTVAVTSLSSEKDQARGRTVGMTDYLVKLDRELLMKSLEGIKRRHRRPTVTA